MGELRGKRHQVSLGVTDLERARAFGVDDAEGNRVELVGPGDAPCVRGMNPAGPSAR